MLKYMVKLTERMAALKLRRARVRTRIRASLFITLKTENRPNMSHASLWRGASKEGINQHRH